MTDPFVPDLIGLDFGDAVVDFEVPATGEVVVSQFYIGGRSAQNVGNATDSLTVVGYRAILTANFTKARVAFTGSGG